MIPIFPHPCHTYFLSFFVVFVRFDNSHPIECEVIVFQYGFNLVSQIISDVVYLFICLLPVCISLEKCLPKSFAHFFHLILLQMSLLLLNQYILILAILTYSEQYEQEIKSPPPY